MPASDDYAGLAEIAEHGYHVEQYSRGAWILTHDSDRSVYTGALMVGSHGCVSPTRWEAIAEAQKRIAQDTTQGAA